MRISIIFFLASMLPFCVLGQSPDESDVTDLSIVSSHLQPLVRSGETVQAALVVRNDGLSVIDSVRVTALLGETDASFCYKNAVEPASQVEIKVDVCLEVKDGIDNVDCLLSVWDACGKADATPENNEVALKTNVYHDGAGFDTPRAILLEYFSTEMCGNCPLRTEIVESVLDELQWPVVWVTHHAGYYYDAFTLGYSESIAPFFYGTKYLYAPAGMLSRRFHENMPGASGKYTTTPVFNVNESYLRRGINAQSELPNFVTVDIATDYDVSSRKLRIKVYGQSLLVTNNLRVNVFITEDGIESNTQSGASGTWVHNHVLREVLTGIDGEPLEAADDGTYLFETEWEAKDSIDGSHATTPIDLANINVVAFISNMNPDDPNDCEVFNCAMVQNAISSGTCAEARLDGVSIKAGDGSIGLSGSFDMARVFSLGGSLVGVLQGGSPSAALMGLNPGVYLVQIISGRDAEVEKVIVR